MMIHQKVATKLVWIAALALVPCSRVFPQNTARPLITGVSHLSVYSEDAAKTEPFYVHDLGAVKRADPENPAGVRYYFSAVQFVEVLPLPAGDTSVNRLDHIAFACDGLQEMRNNLKSRGIRYEERVLPRLNMTQLFYPDPDGISVECNFDAVETEVEGMKGY